MSRAGRRVRCAVDAERVFALTGGNPYFVGELVATADAARVPPTVVDAVHRFSDILAGLAARKEAKVTVAHVLDAFGDRAFGALLAVVAIATLFPCEGRVAVFFQWLTAADRI